MSSFLRMYLQRKLIVISSIVLLVSCSITPDLNKISPTSSKSELNQLNCSVGCIDIVAFDVGQGTTNIVVLPDKTVVMIDAGGSGRNNADAVIDWMNNNLPQGKTVDHLVLSHSDNDHTNLLAKLSEGNSPKIDVRTLRTIHMAGRVSDYTSRAEAKKFFSKIVQNPDANGLSGLNCTTSNLLVQVHLYCYPPNSYATTRITDGLPYNQQTDFYLTMLAVNGSTPFVNQTSIPTAENGDSVVVSLKYKGFTALFGGDMEGVTQNSIQTNVPSDFWKNTSLYIVPHHGALTKGSNSFGFLSLVAPNILVVSSAKSQRDGWNHPDGMLIKGILQQNFSGLSDRLSNSDLHNVLAQYQYNDESIGCSCPTQKAIFTTYTSGTFSLKTDGIYFAYALQKNGPNLLNYCGQAIC